MFNRLKNHLVRLLIVAVSTIAFTLSLAGTPLPAQAGGATLVVSNGSGSAYPCNFTGVNTYLTINLALTAAAPPLTGVTIYICPNPGPYHEFLFISGYTGLSLIGVEMDGLYPQILAPSNISDATTGNNGVIIRVADSTKLKIQGLHIDGNGSFPDYSTTLCGVPGGAAGCFMEGIDLYNTSATISGNYISRIRRNSLFTDVFGYGIVIDAQTGPTVLKPAVTVTNNTIYDYQKFGISVSDHPKVKITNNRIIGFTAAGGPPSVGIKLGQTLGVSVTGNTIKSDYDTSGRLSIGIDVIQSSKAKISGNTIVDVAYGLYLEAYCGAGLIDGLYPQTNGNSVTGNHLTDTAVGVTIYSDAETWSNCDPHADKNKVSGNRITSLLGNGSQGFLLRQIQGGGTPPPASWALGDSFTGNTVLGYANFFVLNDTSGLNIAGLKVSGNVWSPSPAVGAPSSGVTPPPGVLPDPGPGQLWSKSPYKQNH